MESNYDSSSPSVEAFLGELDTVWRGSSSSGDGPSVGQE